MPVEVWVRGTAEAQLTAVPALPDNPATWTEDDVRTLLAAMLRALDHARDPQAEPPPITLRGFSWIVSPTDEGVLVHLDLPLGTASAGPFAVEEARLTTLVARALQPAGDAAPTIH